MLPPRSVAATPTTQRARATGRCRALVAYIVEPRPFAPALHSDGLIAYEMATCALRASRRSRRRSRPDGGCRGGTRRPPRTGPGVAAAERSSSLATELLHATSPTCLAVRCVHIELIKAR